MVKRKRTRARNKPKAATRDVLGAAQRAPRVPNKWRAHHQRLTQLRDHLLNRQVDLAKDAREEQPTFSSHMADAGTDHYDRDFALGMLSSEQDALYEIDEALARITTGSYGICELTGKPIEPGRLEAIPWARFTAAAEAKFEKEGAVKRARLGARDSVARSEPQESDEAL